MEHALRSVFPDSWTPEQVGAAAPVIAAVIVGLCAVAAAFISREGRSKTKRRRKKRLRDQLKKICPHVAYVSCDNSVQADSLCVSLGSNPWVTCRVCSKSFTQEEVQELLEQERTKLERLEVTSLKEAGHDQREALRKAVELRERLDELNE